MQSTFIWVVAPLDDVIVLRGMGLAGAGEARSGEKEQVTEGCK